MTFYPLEFWGIELYRIPGQPIGFFGWQGIIPTKAKNMATVCFDLMTQKLLNIQEIFGRLDPVKFSSVMEDGMLLVMDTIINEAAEQYMGEKWNKLPQHVRDDIVVVAESEAGAFMANFMADLQSHFDDVMDLKAMCVQACVKNKHLLIKIFQECGDKEFVFIRQSGFYFGFLFGLGQMGIFFFYDKYALVYMRVYVFAATFDGTKGVFPTVAGLGFFQLQDSSWDGLPTFWL